MKRLLLYTGAVVTLTSALLGEVKSQDPHLSQYYAAPLFLNPALTGQVNGLFRLTGNVKKQWASLANPYETYAASFDMPVRQFGFGVLILDQRAGDIDLNTLNVLVAASYDVKLGEQGHSHLVFGVQGGIIQRSIDTEKATTDEQYNNSTGFDPNAPVTEPWENSTSLTPDINAGLLFYYGSTVSRLNPFVGVSGFHLTQPVESFMGGTSKIPLRPVGHGGLRIKMTKQFEVVPNVLYMQQNEAAELVGGLSAQYHLAPSDIYFLMGGYYRGNDALIPYLGLQIRDLAFGLSYDVTISDLTQVTDSRGGFEFSVSYIPRKRVPEPKFICPRL